MTTWRWRYGSPPRSKITRIADRPWLDVERTRAHVLGAGEQTFERTRDERFDLRRIEARRFGLHEHVRRREIRKHVEARAEQRRGAEHGDQHAERGDDARMRERRADDRSEHRAPPRPLRGRGRPQAG